MTLPTWLRLLRATRVLNLVAGRGKSRKAVPRRIDLELLEDRTLPATVTLLGNDLVSASGVSLEVYQIPGFLTAQGDSSVNLGPGTYSVEAGGPNAGPGVGTFGTFSVSSQGTVAATTGALMATGNTIDFNLTQLAAITINAGDLTSPQGMPENVSIYYITNNQYYNDTFYLPTGTYSLNSQAGGFPAYGTFTVAQNSSGSFVVSATTGALVANGNTIDFNLTQLAAITIQELTDSTGVPEGVNVDGVGLGTIGQYGPVNTFYLPTGPYTLETFAATTCGTFTVAQSGSGSFVISGTTGALVATGNSIVIDPTQLAAITINVVTDSNDSPEDGALVGVADDRLSPEHTYYVPTGTYEIENAAGTYYGTFTVSNNAPGSFEISGTTGALAANGNTINIVNCALDSVTITPNPGVAWTLIGVDGQQEGSDTVLVPDGSYTIYFYGATGGAAPATFTVGPDGLSDTELPENAPLVSLKLAPCAPALTSAAHVSNGTTIAGTFMGRANTTYQLSFYGDSTASPSGMGLGETLLGSASVLTDGNGDANFTVVVAPLPADETLLDATATDPNGNTSDFSQVICLPSSALGTVWTVYNTADSGAGSLRQAILDADANATGSAASPDEIAFCIPSTDPGYNSTMGAFTIQPHSALPTITDMLVLDGYTQPGASANTLAIGDNAVLKIVLDGTLEGPVGGLVIAGGNTTVRGLVIDNFTGSGIQSGIEVGSDHDVVAGNFIGTDVTGSTALGNSVGIWVASSNNTIGGTTPAARNVISGNISGVYVDYGGGTGNAVVGNYIGTTANGAAALGNTSNGSGGSGIGVYLGGNGNVLGGTAAGAGNVISGNDVANVDADSGAVVQGNFIGTDATGTFAVADTETGIIAGSNNTIGGTAPGAGNLIAGNAVGISFAGQDSNVIQGNTIGQNINGAPLPALGNNENSGITFSGSDNLIGGTAPGAGNVIGYFIFAINIFAVVDSNGNQIQGNTIHDDDHGIIVQGPFSYPADDNTIGGTSPGAGNVIVGTGFSIQIETGANDNLVQGNFIGTDATGQLRKGDYEIQISGNNNTIGGTAAGAGNTIAYNGGSGVDVDSGTGNSILGNSIYDNGDLGILLNSANNANDNQTAPVLTAVSNSNMGTTITGTLQSVASTMFRVEFFANAAMDPSGDGQGQSYLGFATVSTDAGGNASFTATFNTVVPRGYFISATATNLSTGDTSQFSKDLVVGSFLVTNTNDSGAGSLRGAIYDANTLGYGTAASPDLIAFDIPTTDPGYNSTTGAFTIQPLSALPTLTDTAIIDGYTEPGASPNTLTVGDNAVLNIVVSGSLAGSVDGLVIAAGNSTVRGLAIDNFAAAPDGGLVLNGSGNDDVMGNFIGTDVSGESAAPHSNGIVTASPGNVIGGIAPADRNIISGNDSAQPADYGPDGVRLESGGNRVEGDYIGTDRSGTSALGDFNGVFDFNGANTIGGLTGTPGTGAGNVISGNTGFGVALGQIQTLVAGNLIGTTATGLAALNDSGGGISIGGDDNTIGGSTAGARNVISANGDFGIQIGGGAANSGQYNLVEANYIGTDITGTTGLAGTTSPGGQVGITINGAYNTIGGATAAARNIISGNENGIVITSGNQPPYSPFNFSFDNAILGNYIGTDSTGTLAVPNRSGIQLIQGTYDNTIGGTLSGEGNLISGNGLGIVLENSTTNNLIQGNLIGTRTTNRNRLLGNSASCHTGTSISGRANNNNIGGTASGVGNTIAFNGSTGVDVDSGTGNTILGNSIVATTAARRHLLNSR